MATRKAYTREQMANAIEEVRKGQKISTAATKHGVPRITLRNKITGKSPIDRNPGPSTVLTHVEERLLVRWILFMAGKHFPVSKDQLLDSVQKIIADKNLDSCPFPNNRPGKKWYASFLKRHPDLAERTSQNLSKAREDVTEEDLLSWFEVIKSYIENQDLRDAINNPQRIFNADECAFYLQPKAGRVIVRKGQKNVYTASGDEKENLTVLVTSNAAGVLAPPMVVYPYERLPAVIAHSVPKDWCIGRSESGWMCAKTFYEYIANVFSPWIEKKQIPKPVILFLDGHNSHMTLHLSDFCKGNGIEVIALYPNSTHLLQPMDVAVFRPLKVSWKNQVKSWKIENPKLVMKKEHFAPNLEAALQNITADTIRHGFRRSGLFPFGPEYVDMNKLSSQNRATVATSELEKNHDIAKQFMNTLDSEIRTLFSNEKLHLFTRLYYTPRADVEDILPNEDISLYTIWAKTKHFLGEILPQTSAATISDRSLQVAQSSKPVRESAILPQIDAATISECSLQLPLKTPEEYVKDNSFISGLPENILSGCEQISRKTPEMLGTENIQPSDFGATTSHVCTENKAIDDDNPNLESDMQSLQTIPKEIPVSTMYTTPNKAQASAKNTTSISKPSPLKSQNFMEGNIPSPFKRALFWPEPETKKRRTKERIPSAITGEAWRSYVMKKENEKKQKEEQKQKRIKERKEKQLLKMKIAEEKKINKRKTTKNVNRERNRRLSSSSSSEDNIIDIQYEESDQDLELSPDDQPDHRTEAEESDEDNVTLAALQLPKKNTYVIIKYEGEYFPGLIKNIDNNSYEVSTMVLSKGNSFRWPETPDQIWYDKDTIIEKIQEPQLFNKRGFYKVPEMQKYLPFLCE